MFFANKQLSQVDTPGLISDCIPQVYYESADGQLAYLVLTDIPLVARGRFGVARGRLGVTAHYPSSKIDEGTIEIEARSYRLRNGRVLLVKTAGGPDHVRQIAMPSGASTPEGSVRELFENDLAFRNWVKDVLHNQLDSVSLRDEAAIGLYKTRLASELPQQVLRDFLDDDSSWVRLMAASGLWDSLQNSDAVHALLILAENEVIDWPTRLARRELAKIRVEPAQRNDSTLPSNNVDNSG